MLLIALVALVLAIGSPNELVKLLIFGYCGVAQFFPGMVLGLFVRRATARPVLLGLLAGEAVVVALIWSGNDPFLCMNAGFVGLAVNSVVALATLAPLRASTS
jgi:SSS family solute:Na+ symporter